MGRAVLVGPGDAVGSLLERAVAVGPGEEVGGGGLVGPYVSRPLEAPVGPYVESPEEPVGG